MGFNKIQVKLFFDNLRKCFADQRHPPHNVYNMDESGVSTVPNKVPKLLSPVGKKSVKSLQLREGSWLQLSVVLVLRVTMCPQQ